MIEVFDTIQFIDEIAEYLATQLGTAVGGASGTIFKFALPENPSDCIAVFGTGGIIRGDNPVKPVDTQVLVRSATIPTGLWKAQEVYNLLDGKVNILATYKTFSDPLAAFVGSYFRDSQNRLIFPLNFRWTLTW